MLDISSKARGFTLVELLIVVAIVGTLATSIRLLNFEAINNSKKAELFTTQVARGIENIRNNSLYGRSLGVQNPLSWRMNISMLNGGTVSTEYLSGSTWLPYDDAETNYTVMLPREIVSLGCDNSGDISSGTGTIVYEGSELSLSGSCSLNDKYLEIGTAYVGNTGSVVINSISGVIETRDGS